MIQEGQILNHTYEVRRKIGEGGGGNVYLGWHVRLQKPVAIKKLKGRFVGRINERHEADILKGLHHKYLPQVYDFLQIGEDVYTVIDYIDGNSMKEYIGHRAVFEEKQVIRWTCQLLEALEYLHTQDPPIIHGDIKPANIMIDKNGNVCLIDFNVSFGENGMPDTVGYSEGSSSPEQWYQIKLYSSGGKYQDIKIDARSDIFSLGASMYMLMTGKNPVEKLREGKALWSGREIYSESFRKIIASAIEKNPEKRYQSAHAMLQDIYSMGRRDAEVIRLRRHQTVFTAVFAALLTAGAMMGWAGFRTTITEEFENRVAAVREMAEQHKDDGKTLQSEAADILNERKYAEARNRDTASVADLYYVIGNVFFEEEDYKNAADCFKKAIENNRTNPDYTRDYAISLARNNQIVEAQSVIDHSGRDILRDDNLAAVQGEIALANQNYLEAASKLEHVIDETSNEEVLYRAYIDCADAYGKLNKTEDRISVLKTGSDDQTLSGPRRRNLLSRLSSAYIEAINARGAEQAGSMIEEAERVCQKLMEEATIPDFTDYYNYAELLSIEGRYEEAQNMLLSGQDAFGDDYRFWMELANLEIRKMQTVDESVRNYDQARKFDACAEEYYETIKREGKTDPDMQELENVMRDLKAAGW